jgi:hypothetical protein
MQGGPGTQAKGKHREGTGVSGGLNLATREDVPAVVIPDQRGRSAGQPRPSQALLSAQIVGPKRAQRLLQDRGPRGVPIGNKKRQTIEEKFGGTPGLCAGPRFNGRPRDHTRAGVCRTPTRGYRGGQSIKVGLARPSHVEALELPGGFEQEGGSVVAPVGREGEIWARSRSSCARWKSSSRPRSAMSARRRAESTAPAWRLASAATSARPARRAGSTVNSVDRSMKAAAAANPPRAWARPAESSSSAATPSSARCRCQVRVRRDLSGT